MTNAESCDFCETDRPVVHRSGANTFGQYSCWCEPCWEKTKAGIEQGLKELHEGKGKPLSQVKKELGL